MPIYVADTVAKALPIHAPTKSVDNTKGLKKWKQMDEQNFVFSLYPNDLIRIYSSAPISVNRLRDSETLLPVMTVPGEQGMFLYYKSMDISRGALEAITHDNTYQHRTIGKSMLKIEKYAVDVLGNVRKVEKETRQTFDRRKKG